MKGGKIWVVVVLFGAVILFANRHALTDNDPRMSAAELLTASAQAEAPLVLDVRSREEFRDGHVPGAVNVEYRLLPRVVDRLEADPARPVVVYCETGYRSRIARSTLRDAGFTEIYQLEGDMRAWRAQRRPVSRPAAAG
jgi:rhodanese-related sulfurtransferase